MHPVGGREVGWDQVRGSWEQVAKIVSGGQIKLEDQFVQIIGDVAYELGVERGQYTLAGQPGGRRLSRHEHLSTRIWSLEDCPSPR